MNLKEKVNKKYMQISLYVIVTVIIIYTLSLLVKNAPAVINEVLDKVRWLLGVIKPVILGFVFAYIVDPMVNFFERRYQKLQKYKILRRLIKPRPWAAFTAIICLVLAAAALISLLVYTVTDQIRLANFDDFTVLAQSYLTSLQALIQTISDKLDDLNIQSEQFQNYIKNATTYLGDGLYNFASSTLSSMKNISGSVTTFIFSFIIGIYFMIDGELFMNYLRKVSKALFSENTNRRNGRAIHDLDQVFSGYIRGQLTDALVMMVLISTALSVTGVKFAIIIGIFAGIGNLIPYFGPIVAYVSTTIVCLISGDLKTWIISIIALFVIQTIDGNLIGPRLLSQSIQIHPLIVMISLIFGSAMGGFLGMLIAVPIGAYLKLVFVRFVDHRLEEANPNVRKI